MEEDQPIIIDIVIARSSRMPGVYREWGGPLRWQDDVTGELPKAVQEFFQLRSTTSPARLELVRDYCQYYISAPCWDANPYSTEEGLEELRTRREEIKQAKTFMEINAWIHKCLGMGIDPL